MKNIKGKNLISGLFLFIITGILLFGFFVLTPARVSAYVIEQLPNVKNEGDFTVGPAQNEIFLGPAESTVRNLMITNRAGVKMNFRITMEDFKGSETGESAAILLDTEKGPYSLKDYIRPDILEFNLNHGERMVLPVQISVPRDSEPGGLYGAVLVSALPPASEIKTKEGEAMAGIKVTGRVAALYFVRVKGDIKEDGFLKEIKTADGKKFYEGGSVSFNVLYQNNGNVHLDPYGLVEIKNILGKKVGEIEMRPWFALPRSLRSRIVTFDKGWTFGYYTATAKVNRGYGDIVDEKSVGFWILPWKVAVGFLLAIVLLAFMLRWLKGNFEIRKKVQQ